MADSSNYTVFARKYRPQTFEELVGQEHVARTLGNAINAGRVAHAFLFTGVRGVGKTTTARLLAKALNCETGPTASPCNECQVCQDITAGVDMDVQEIDGASNNSVEDVRRLQESLPFRPARDRFKIVIVDEVHMLSSGAFNAFLKTLEEPPEHVKFIFATTEAHKVPVTIRSRCQRYDFRLIPQGVIAGAVKRILENEEVKADDDAVGIVAQEAGGSMRDALTLLDQLVAFGGKELVGDTVSQHLGIASRAAVQGMATALLDGNPKTVLKAVSAMTNRGADPLHFIRQLLQFLRDLVVLRVTEADTSLVDLVDEERNNARTLSGSHDPLELQRVFAAATKLVDDIARASAPKLVLEMGLVRIATRPRLQDLGSLLGRLERLEQVLAGQGPGGGSGGGGNGGGGRGAAGRGAAGGGAPSSGTGGPAGGYRRGGPSASAGAQAAGASSPGTSTPSAAPRPPAAGMHARSPEQTPFPQGSAPQRGPARDGSPQRQGQTHPTAPMRGEQRTPSEESPPTGPKPSHSEQRRPEGRPEERRPEERRPEGRPEQRRPEEPRPEGRPEQRGPESAGQAASSPARAPHPATSNGAPPRLRRAAMQEWESIVGALKEARPALAAILEHGIPRVVSAEKIVISFQRNSFYGRQAESPASQQCIFDAAIKHFGVKPELEIRFDADSGGNTVASVEAGRRSARVQQRRREAAQHPIVLDALAVFPESRGHIGVRLEGH